MTDHARLGYTPEVRKKSVVIWQFYEAYPPRTSRASARGTPSLLTRCRRPAVGWLQLFIILFWIVCPALRTNAIYVPDSSGNPYWLPMSAGDYPQGGPDWGDADENGTPDSGMHPFTSTATIPETSMATRVTWTGTAFRMRSIPIQTTHGITKGIGLKAETRSLSDS